jgi:hypothetical protein
MFSEKCFYLKHALALHHRAPARLKFSLATVIGNVKEM